MDDTLVRCAWAGHSQLERDYHDLEWGRPLHDEARLFEMLILEGHQAGLSWLTILKKREHYRNVYDNFQPEKIALWDDKKVEGLLADPGIIRNRRKVLSARDNAQAYLKMRAEGLTLDGYLWRYVDGIPIVNQWDRQEQVPANTELSDRVSKDLRRRGFHFVGSTIVYALLQSTGLVDDHLTCCFVRTGAGKGAE